jgi:hypothetical protein
MLLAGRVIFRGRVRFQWDEKLFLVVLEDPIFSGLFDSSFFCGCS